MCSLYLWTSALAPLQPGTPLLDALAGAGAGEDALDAGVDGVEVTQEHIQVEVQVLQQVHLVDEHEVCRAEHERVLERFLLALCDRVDHDARVLAYLELGGAD